MPEATITRRPWTLSCYAPGSPDPEPPLLAGFGPRGQPIYPYPTVETFATTPQPRTLDTVVLENQYLRLTFVPALNARLYSVHDKLTDREVLYANPELKPGLVGLRGVWHAAGIEVNFPCSHTVTTTDEIAWDATVDDDGRAQFSAWDLEAVSGMAWQCTTTLEPESARVIMETRLANPTDLPHRYYFWVNAAFPILEGSRYIFPPSTSRIFNEGGGYSGEAAFLDYPVHDGVDISRFENLRGHSAFFAVTPDEGFFGLHHPSIDAGIVHYADPGLVPGRKIWSWGFAPDGEVWHRALTDTGGPYCEVQSGPLRSQLEYRTLAPGQEIEQRDVWLPTRGLGGLSYAAEGLAACWTIADAQVELQLLTAEAAFDAVVAIQTAEGSTMVEAELGPEPTLLILDLPSGERPTLSVIEPGCGALLERAELFPPAERRHVHRLASPRATTPYQRGRWLEWHGDRQGAYRAYREAAEEHAEAATALARFALERDQPDRAARWAERALALDCHDPTAVLAAALAARLEGRTTDAQWLFEQLLAYPSSRLQGRLGLVDASLAAGRFEQAGGRCDHLLAEGADVRLVGRLVHGLRRLGRLDAASMLTGRSAGLIDPLAWAEERLADADTPPLSRTAQLAAAELLHRFGDIAAAVKILDDESGPAPGTPAGLLEYAKAYLQDDCAGEVEWGEGFAAGAFAIRVLKHAVAMDDGDDTAHFHLGCALAAAGDWETAANHWAVASDGQWAAVANRNLGLYTWQVTGDKEAAAAFYRHALECGAGPRTFFEQDLLLAELGLHEQRADLLRAATEQYPGDTRVPLRLAAAMLDSGRPEEALHLLGATTFQLFEGGYAPQGLWVRAHRKLAEQAVEAGDWPAAAEHFLAATTYPQHLGVGAPATNQIAELWYRCGEAMSRCGRDDEARRAYESGAETDRLYRAELLPMREILPEHGEPRRSRRWVENRCYRALCLQRLGRADEAAELLRQTTDEARSRGADDALLRLLDDAAGGAEPA